MTAELGASSPVTIKGGLYDELGVSEKSIRVVIDKMKIRMDFTSSKASEYIQIQEWARSVRYHEFGNKSRVWSEPGRSQTNVSQRLDGGGTLFILFGRHRGEFRAWFEFNPNKVVIAELEGHLSTMLEKGMYSLLERGIVTYCEFAIDVPKAQIEEYVFLSRTHRQQDLRWISKGAIYIGSRNHGELHFHIYDKQKQLREVDKKEIDDPLLRIESRIRGKRRFPLSDLLDLQSPFSSLLVLRKSRVEQLIADGLLGDTFSVQGTPHELQYQLSCLGGHHKKPVIDRLSEFEVHWWSPDSLWSKLEQSLDWLHEGTSYSGWV